jgi:hypothetical protein
MQEYSFSITLSRNLQLDAARSRLLVDATEGCDPPLKGPAVKASLVRAHEPSELDPDNCSLAGERANQHAGVFLFNHPLSQPAARRRSQSQHWTQRRAAIHH